MFQRIAIVARGEPAMRLIQAVREFNRERDTRLQVIALFTDPDRRALFVREADEAHGLGSGLAPGPQDREINLRYLELPALELALREIRADAVWLGWDAPCQRADLVELCDRLGIVCIGPPVSVIRKLSDPAAMKLLAEEAGIPVAVSSDGPAARRGRRIEVPIVGDGNKCWAFGAYDCTLQLGDSSILVEAPCPVLTAEQDRGIRDAAVRLGEALGYTSAGTVQFLYDPEPRRFALERVKTELPAGHAATEVTAGLDLVKLQIHLAQGGRLEGEPPAVRGHAVELRLSAEDPDRSLATAPRSVELFRLPTGPGVRVDAAVGEGDEVSPTFNCILARVIAYGCNRGEAFARLERALSGTAVALRGAMTNKGFLLRLLDDPEVQAGRYDIASVERLVAAGEQTSTRHAPIALIEAGIRAYEQELAAEKARFFELASRGRPAVRNRAGHTVELGYRGNRYELRVYRLGPRRYQVAIDGCTIEVTVEPRGVSDRQLVVGGRRYHVFSMVHGLTDLVEVDGIPHRISLARVAVVRAPSPAVVVSVAVKEGEEVAVGDRLVVLEAMKLELTVVSDFAGIVRQVAVRSNVQVGTASPLLFIEPTEAQIATVAATRVRFGGIEAAAARAEREAVSQSRLERLRSLMLGYDVDPDELGRTMAGGEWLRDAVRPDDQSLCRGEDEILSIFVDITSLFRRQPTSDESGEEARRSSEEYLFTYLRDLNGKDRRLPVTFLNKLERVVAHYGVPGLDRTPELEESLFRIARAHRQIDQRLVPILSILEHRRAYRDVLAPFSGEEFRLLLDRLIDVTQGLLPAVNDAAREVRFRYFEQPRLRRARQQAHRDAEEKLEKLAREPDPARRTEYVEALVAHHQPLHDLVSSRLDTADPEVRPALLEVLTRRYYRIRNLENVRAETIGGHCLLSAEYEHEGKRIHVVTTHAHYDRFPEVAGKLSALLSRYPADHDVVADFYVWKDGPPGDPDTAAAEVARVLSAAGFSWPLRRVVISLSAPQTSANRGGLLHVTLRPSAEGYAEERYLGAAAHRSLHPMTYKRLHLWRLANFHVDRLPSAEDICVLRAIAGDNPKDERFFGIAEVRDVTAVRDDSGGVVEIPHLESMFMEVVEEMRHAQAKRPTGQRLLWNRIVLYVWPPLALRSDEFTALVRRLAPATEGVGLECVMVHVKLRHPRTGALRETVLTLSSVPGGGISVRFDEPESEPIKPLSEYEQKVLGLKQRGLYYPYELIRMLTSRRGDEANQLPPADFQEYDFDDHHELVAISRPYGNNSANIVVGTIRNFTPKYPEGMERVILLGDPSRGMGNLAESECRRINAGLELARRKGVPCEWFALSAGARIAMDSGTENMDWIALTLRRIVEYTQAGGELNIVSVGINVGAQPYWNAEATMLMHTRGVLIMTPEAAMVLTGKRALDYSGGVSAEDNFGIGGYDRIMGPNGQAQYGARDLTDACRILLRHYDHTYVAPGERFPRRAATSDSPTRDVRAFPHGVSNGTDLDTVGDIFSEARNPGRKKPFDIRRVMRSVTDEDHEPLERWYALQDGEIAVVWDAHIGGYPVCLLGIESQPLPRLGFIPADGPDVWTGGTLFPRSSKKVARAINAASKNRPVVVLANLSGFDGSPESMRNWQLEYGAEIGRAIVNFRGPIVFVVVSRYHGGAFVVFSNRLNENLEIAAVEGAYASVIGGAPAAAVVFAREVKARTRCDERIKALEREIEAAEGAEKVRLQARLEKRFEEVYAEKLGEVANEFDSTHSIYRAQQVGSVHRIIAPERLRPYVIEAIERGMQRELERIGHTELADGS